MIKVNILILLLITGMVSCSSKEDIDLLKITEKYYKALDESDTSLIKTLLQDSLLTRENEYYYEQKFAKEEYVEWIRWDSVFDPSYEILEIKQIENTVKIQISKKDKRVLFLHEKPIVTNQVVHFNKNKIALVETVEYVVYNDSLFVRNRQRFLDWIDKNHPELAGVIYDQTRIGGMKYLRAIELYQKKNH